MKINSIETFSTEFIGFARITVEDGSQGWSVEINDDWLGNTTYQISEST